MRASAVLALLVATLGAQPAAANLLTFHCEGFSMEPGGNQVAVMRSFHRDGKQYDAVVLWFPKSRLVGPAYPRTDISLDLQLTYSLTPANRIGAMKYTALTVQIVASPGPARNKSPEYRRAELAKLKVDVAIDGMPPRPVTWGADERFSDWPLSTTRWGMITIPPSARALVFTVRDGDGKVVRISRYDLDQTAGRDAQFEIARGKADASAADYKRCRKMG
ncbi:MAG: hypothetical protein J0L50_14370 [Sphingomonadales bacterium]|nr:hypothetical protein [Sphingomonadales bacterium]